MPFSTRSQDVSKDRSQTPSNSAAIRIAEQAAPASRKSRLAGTTFLMGMLAAVGPIPTAPLSIALITTLAMGPVPALADQSATAGGNGGNGGSGSAGGAGGAPGQAGGNGGTDGVTGGGGGGGGAGTTGAGGAGGTGGSAAGSGGNGGDGAQAGVVAATITESGNAFVGTAGSGANAGPGGGGGGGAGGYAYVVTGTGAITNVFNQTGALGGRGGDDFGAGTAGNGGTGGGGIMFTQTGVTFTNSNTISGNVGGNGGIYAVLAPPAMAAPAAPVSCSFSVAQP